MFVVSALAGKANTDYTHAQYITATDIPDSENLSVTTTFFGQSIQHGCAATFARSDHQHPLPANPTPSTVTQAVAEAGTATACASWTSQRVRQACNAAIIAAGLATIDHTHGIDNIANLQTTLNAKIDGNIAGIVSGTSSTAVGTAAKTVSMTGFTRTVGSIIAITFTNGNSSASATLNISSTGAAGIRMLNRTTVPVINNIPAGYIAYLYYDGEFWILLDPANLATANSSALGIAAIGISNLAARADLVHALPTLANLGEASSSHTNTQYATTADIPTLSSLGAAPENIVLTATSNRDTTTTTSAVASATIQSVLQTVWSKIRSVVNAMTAHINTNAAGTTFGHVRFPASSTAAYTAAWRYEYVNSGGTHNLNNYTTGGI